MLNLNASRPSDLAGATAGFLEDTWSSLPVERFLDSVVQWKPIKDLASAVFAAPPSPHDVQVPMNDGTLYVTGPGDVNAIDWDDIKQGNMANCYLVASMAAIAHENPQAIRDMITPNLDPSGNVASYTVHLHQRNALGRLEPVDVTVDASQFSQNAARPGDSDGTRQEIWPLIIEKAYAQLHGGYSNIANGGSPEYATEVLTGKEANAHSPGSYGFDQLGRDLAAGRPVTAWTPPADGKKAELLGGVGLVGWHAYAVVDTKVENGVQMVKVYNPWGHSQPGDGTDDGGWMSYADFQKHMSAVSVGSSVEKFDFLDIFKNLDRFRNILRG